MYIFELQFPLDICPVAGSYGGSVFRFLRALILCFAVAAPIYILANNVQVFPFSISSPAFVICVLFDGVHSDRCEVISHCGLHLHFLED